MSDVLIDRPELASLGQYEFGWHDADAAGATAQRGLSEAVVRGISTLKDEPEWMLKNRLKGLQLFGRKPMPTWGADLSEIDFDNIKYFVRSTEKQAGSWEELPEDIRNTYERLGIPEAERQRLVAGVAAQYESEVVYHQINEQLEAQGVIFMDTDTALREHPEFFTEYFGTVIPAGDNKFAALNTAVWSGGSFVYVPPGVHVEIPLQAYFRINTENMGQFERTLIIADEGSYVHYIEGCTAPIYKSDSLHSAVVEIIVKKNARVRYTTIQNWSNNVYNLVTKRAIAHEGATMEWIDGNIGSKVTMKYPSIFLVGERAKGETLSVAFAGPGQHQDAGAKMIHMAPYTQSSIVSKSIARGGGRAGLPRRGAGGGQRAPLREHGALRRAAGRHDLALRHLSRDRHPRRRRAARPRGDRLEGQRGAAVLPAVPWHARGRGDGDDRARLHRADRPRTSHGVRHGAQQAHRDGHGRIGRLDDGHDTGARHGARFHRAHRRRLGGDPRADPLRAPPLVRSRGLRGPERTRGQLEAHSGRPHRAAVRRMPRPTTSRGRLRRRRARGRRGRRRDAWGSRPRGEVFEPEDRSAAIAWTRSDEALYVRVARGRRARPRPSS